MNTTPIFPFSTYLYALLDVRGDEMNCRLRHFPVYDQRRLWLDKNIFFYVRKMFLAGFLSWRVPLLWEWCYFRLFVTRRTMSFFLQDTDYFFKIQTYLYFSNCIEIYISSLKVKWNVVVAGYLDNYRPMLITVERVGYYFGFVNQTCSTTK